MYSFVRGYMEDIKVNFTLYNSKNEHVNYVCCLKSVITKNRRWSEKGRVG